MTLKWWEKTVEYYFIIEYFGGSISIAPLDGQEERAGDAIFSSNNRWLIIEFKKDEQSLSSEQDKFNNYSIAKQSLSDSDGHHFIIYGDINNQENPSRFVLKGRTYFSEKLIKSVEEMLKKGATKQEFTDYLGKLLRFKKGMKSSGSGGLGLENYNVVAGINSDGKVTQCMSLLEAGLELGLEPEISREQDKEQGRSI